MANNNELYDSAYSGSFAAANFANKNPNTSTATNYLLATQKSQAFALKVDSLIATATITVAQRLLMESICFAYWENRALPSTTQLDYAGDAAIIAAAYAEAILLLL